MPSIGNPVQRGRLVVAATLCVASVTFGAAPASAVVVAPPSIAKSFSAATVPLNGSVTLTFTITNPNGATDLTGVDLNDNLPSNLIIANPDSLSGGCDPGVITTAASNINLVGGTILASSSCTFSIDVLAVATGPAVNTTDPVTSNEGGTGNTATATVDVAPAPPVLNMSFPGNPIFFSQTTPLQFAITNPNPSDALTALNMTNTLPAGLVVATPNGLAGSCGTGTLTAIAGSSTVTLAAGTLAGNGSCMFSVNVAPTSPGVKNNDATVDSSAGTSDSATASLLVNSTAAISPNPASVAFGNVHVGALGGPTPVTITNIGNLDLHITKVSVSGTSAAEFTTTSDCTSTVSPGAHCTVTLTMGAVAPGAKTAALQIDGDQLGAPTLVPLTGTGTQPAITAPAAVDLGHVTVGSSSAPTAIAVTNGGNETLHVASAAIGGADATQFSSPSTTCASVAPGASCAISAVFTPASSGAKSATLTISSDAPTSPTAVTLSATGDATPTTTTTTTTTTPTTTTKTTPEPPATSHPTSLTGDVGATETLNGDGIDVTCVTNKPSIKSCTVTASPTGGTGASAARAGSKTVHVGHRGSRKVKVHVPLSAASVSHIEHSLSGVPYTVSFTATSYGTSRVLRSTRRTRVVAGRIHLAPKVGNFGPQSSTLMPALKRYLLHVALAVGHARKVVCTGYTAGGPDSSRGRAFRMRLSQRRAMNVCGYLRAHGLSAAFATVARGSANPRATNANAAGQTLNRRVELTILR